MTNASQRRAVVNHRRRLGERGISRYEVRGLDADKELVRDFAKQLAANDALASRLRAQVAQQLAGGSQRRGGILAALRRSPLVGAELHIEREVSHGRRIKL